MNIQEAKEEIRRAVRIYLKKDAYGNYRIPALRQRPVFLTGAPGIGKTAIMEQLSAELDLPLVSYSMTHHTRQSALGLPFIVHKRYQGEKYDVSEYTMSEIIASVYEAMERTGKKEGLLFLDEINCVSETLSPSMLQFLQYKTFGNHRMPEGWVIVTAGNPPEFNRSVREFDIVTMDRLRLLEAEADYGVWKRYAAERKLHRAVRTYLDIRREDFFVIEQDGGGRRYVTPRGWEDLSEALVLYEEMEFPVSESLISQYLRHPRIIREFATYYDLYDRYRGDYQILKILEGTEDPSIRERAAAAGFDERLTVTGLLTGALLPEMAAFAERQDALRGLLAPLRAMRPEEGGNGEKNAVINALISLREDAEEHVRFMEASRPLSAREKRTAKYPAVFADKALGEIRARSLNTPDECFEAVRMLFESETASLRKDADHLKSSLDHLFGFLEACFGDGNEMLMAVTEMTMNRDAALFIAENGCELYFRYQKRFMISERGRELRELIRSYQRGGAEGEK